jgi:hypothetical protein
MSKIKHLMVEECDLGAIWNNETEHYEWQCPDDCVNHYINQGLLREDTIFTFERYYKYTFTYEATIGDTVYHLSFGGDHNDIYKEDLEKEMPLRQLMCRHQ